MLKTIGVILVLFVLGLGLATLMGCATTDYGAIPVDKYKHTCAYADSHCARGGKP